jgi:hypothetical protein
MWLFIGGLVCFVTGVCAAVIFGWELGSPSSRSKVDYITNSFIVAFFAACGLWLVIFTATNNEFSACLDHNLQEGGIRFICNQTSVWETVSMTGRLALLWVIPSLLGVVIHLIIRLTAYFFRLKRAEIVG